MSQKYRMPTTQVYMDKTNHLREIEVGSDIRGYRFHHINFSGFESHGWMAFCLTRLIVDGTYRIKGGQLCLKSEFHKEQYFYKD